jgi:alpha-amylase
MSPEAASKALRTVAREKAFYFFTSIGNYTGVSASSLKEFVDRINEVNVRSLEFHVNRGDFEKWVNEVLEDSELAGEIKKLQKSNLAGEDLRSQVYMTFLKRLKRLTGQVSPSYF